MDRFDTGRAWAPEAPHAPRKSWFVDESTPEPIAAWRDPKYDIMPFGNGAAADAAADKYMGTLDERAQFNPNTHPEYRKWLEQTKAATEFLETQEAKIAAAYNVDYAMEGRAFGVPVAKPGTELRLYQEYDNDGSRVAPGHAKSFYYAVDPRTGQPVTADMDGWAPTGKAAELDNFVKRTTWDGGAPAGLVNPATWELREGVMPARLKHDAADDMLAAGSAALAAQFNGGQHVQAQMMQTQMQTQAQSPIRLITRPTRAAVQTVDNMNEASAARAGEYAAEQADAAATLEGLRAQYTATGDPRVAAALNAQVAAMQHYANTVLAPQPTSPSPSKESKHVEATLRNMPMRAVVPCMINTVRGAAYDLAHWNELPTAEQGVLPTLQFVTMRDGRGSFFMLWILVMLLAVVIVFAVAPVGSKKQSTTVPLWVAALAAGNPQLASAAYQP